MKRCHDHINANVCYRSIDFLHFLVKDLPQPGSAAAARFSPAELPVSSFSRRTALMALIYHSD